MFEKNDVVIVKPGLRDPKLSEPTLGIIVNIISDNLEEPLWSIYTVLIDTELIDVSARRLIKPSVFQHLCVQS